MGILHPLGDGRLMMEILLVLRKMKSNDELGVEGRTSNSGGLRGLQLSLKLVPDELFGQFHQTMLQVYDALELGPKKAGLNGENPGLWLHGFSQFLQVTIHFMEQKPCRNFRLNCLCGICS